MKFCFYMYSSFLNLLGDIGSTVASQTSVQCSIGYIEIDVMERGGKKREKNISKLCKLV